MRQCGKASTQARENRKKRMTQTMTSEESTPSEHATMPSTIVFLHGSGDDAHVWDEVIANLPECTTVALDLPGHGELIERPGPATMSVADYADAVRAELARRDLRRVCVVGHSLGGAIALQLALDHPALVGGLVLVGSGARLRVTPELLDLARTDQTAAGHTLKQMGFTADHAAQREAFESQRAPLAPGMLHRDLAACDAFDVMAHLGKIAQPTLIVTGESDALTPPKYARYLHANIAHSEVVLVPGAGHYLPIEEPTTIASAIRRWLTQTPSPNLSPA